MATNDETRVDGQTGAIENATGSSQPETEAELSAQPEETGASAPWDQDDAGGGIPIPPADFTFLVYSLSTQAQLQLGLLRLDESSPAEPNLPIARHTIDLLAMLQQKTQGNLSLPEKLLLENTLTDLRYRFVQATEQASKQGAAS